MTEFEEDSNDVTESPPVVAVPTLLLWNGAALRRHPSRELAQADLDDCVRRRNDDVARALGVGHEDHAEHVGVFLLQDAPVEAHAEEDSSDTLSLDDELSDPPSVGRLPSSDPVV